MRLLHKWRLKVPALLVSLALTALLSAHAAAAARYWQELGAKYDKPTPAVVKAVQFLLKAHGLNLTADGIYGSLTRREVSTFQRSHGLNATGTVNAPTWEALIVTVRHGSKGNAVKALQTLLLAQGYHLSIDGKFGASSEHALRAFQKQQGHTPDGVAGPYTWCGLTGGDSGSDD